MDETHNNAVNPKPAGRMTRREWLKMGGAVVAGSAVGGVALRWIRNYEGTQAEVFIGKASSYDEDLVSIILAGLKELDVTNEQIRGKSVLLKPNLVETAEGIAHINTHPAMVVAAATAFRRLGATQVIVGEGQGHRRDSWLVLEESGMQRALDEARLPFVDLNHDDVVAVPNAGQHTDLETLYLPRTVCRADIVVSMPKVKTHHWTGVTCAMKNMFGIMPGVVYGWPKNVLHWAGLAQSILDINATMNPTLAIADGVVGMEGDGPIMGSPKQLGAIVIGRNLTAVDATCTRLMELNPHGVTYLAAASGRFGPIREQNIEQRGESIASLSQPFAVIDAPHLAAVANRAG